MKALKVWEHLPNGKKRKRILKRDHTCTNACLIVARGLGRLFYSCKRFSYRGD